MISLTLEIVKLQNKLPCGKIVFNNIVIHNGEYNENTFKFKPIIGTNILKISLENKVENRDTVLKGNQIVKDLAVIIKDIRCEITKDQVTMYDDVGIYETDRGETLKTHGYLSYNGTYTFKFDYPLFVFQRNKLFYQ